MYFIVPTYIKVSDDIFNFIVGLYILSIFITASIKKIKFVFRDIPFQFKYDENPMQIKFIHDFIIFDSAAVFTLLE
jgi:hypothetical protein